LTLALQQDRSDRAKQARAANSQVMAWIGHDAMFDPLRAESRFKALIKKSNFVE
jgi:hypothetical protein